MNSTLRKVVNKSLSFNGAFNFSSGIRGLLSTRISNFPLKNAIRFENQSKTWTYNEVERHSNAVAYGLLELGYKKGDKIVFWVDRGFTSEITMAQIGLAKIGVSIVPFSSSNLSELENTLKETEAAGLFFSPNTKFGEEKRVNAIHELFPEINKAYAGVPLNYNKFPKMKHLIHTGFNSVPGTLKYKQVLVYGNPNFQTNKISDSDDSAPLFYSKNKGVTFRDIENQNQEFRGKNGVSDTDTILVLGDPNSPTTFAYGVYNSLAFGNYTILSGNEKFKSSLEKLAYQHPHYVIINEKYSKDDLQNAASKEGTDKLKNIFVAGSDPSLVKNAFGGKDVTSFA